MKILRLRVDGFGGLQGEWMFSPDRVNVIVDDNERGKSSLFAAITAALYGLDGDRRTHRVLTPLERWRPWNGGPFRVALDIECTTGMYTIARDFDSGVVAVFDRSGREVTPEFLEGRDEYPIGKKLMGLDLSEFEKCALLAQGELDTVVPGDEKARRASSLKSRLENAADTHIGDTNASEALRVLEEALRRFHAHEIDFTGTIDNAIDRLVAKRELIEVDIREIDATLIVAQAPLDELHQSAHDERCLQDQLRELEAERRAGLAVDVRRQLDDHEGAETEVARLEAEAAELAASANLPLNAEGELRDTIARHEEAVRGIEGLESRRRDELAREREAIARERRDLSAYDEFTSEDADRCVSQASELRQILLQDAVLRHQVFELRDVLASKGYEPEQIQFLQQRFGDLPPESVKLLRQQAELNLVFQNDSNLLEQQRANATDTLRAVDAARGARRTPGWVLLAIGVAAALAGAIVLLMRGETLLGMGLLSGGSLAAFAGVALLGSAASTRRDDRDDALSLLAEAQGRINSVHRRRTENESGLADLARLMGYRDSVDLLRQFGEYARLLEDSGPLLRTQEQLQTLDGRRQFVLSHTRPLLELTGESALTPELLEKVAYDARRSIAARARLADLERGFGWVEEEKRVLETTANSMRDRAVRLLQSAGVTYDPGRGWAHHVTELKRRMEGRVRYTMVVEELIPAARRRLHPDHDVQQRRRQLEMLMAGGDLPANARSSADIEVDVKQTRNKLEETQRRRTDLRVEVEEVWRRHAQRRPELGQDQERMGRAIERAKRFKQAAELARDTIESIATDTHRKWADFLNDRVAAILGSFGTSVDGLRFGEDLDFSVQMDGGPLVSRGKAHLQLSAGARDQLYLAVRLAISEFLSRGTEALPLLIDDVFASSDDGRLRSGMRSLIESFGVGHQVLLTTCHRGRMTELQRIEPELFRERVHMLDLSVNAGAKGL